MDKYGKYLLHSVSNSYLKICYQNLSVLSEPIISIRNNGSLCNEKGVPLVLNNDRKTLLGTFEAYPNCLDRGLISQFIDIYPYVNLINVIIDRRANTSKCCDKYGVN